MNDLFGGLPKLSSAGFDAAWQAYPRKVGKDAARRAWEKALKKPGVTPQLILERVVQYGPVSQLKAKQFIPHMSTWLSQARWDDDLEFEMEAAHAAGLTHHERRGDERLDRLKRYHAAPVRDSDSGD